MAELRQLGGALARPAVGGGALSHLDADFVAFGGGMAMTPRWARPAYADANRLTEALAPLPTAGSTSTSPRTRSTLASAYGDRAWTQLTGIRSAVDPDGLFVANHPVPRLFENGQPTT